MRPHAILPLVGVLLLAGCREPHQFQPPPPPPVTVALPQQRVIAPTLDIVGRTEALVSVEIRARVVGFLESVEFSEGAQVNKGDLLFRIESAEYEAALAAAQAGEAEALALAEQTAAEQVRIESLIERNAASEKELIDARAAAARAAAALLAARAQSVRARLDLEYTEIRAPISGRINRTSVDVGNLVGQGEPTLLTTVVTWDPIAVYFNANERSVLEFRRGRVDQEGYPDVELGLELADGTRYPLTGRIDYADNEVDPETGTLRVRAVFPNPDLLLLPGIFARVRIPKPEQEALLVPETSLQRDLTGYFLLTVDENSQVVRNAVTTGPADGELRAIESGLRPDERVIVRGLQRVRPGLTVTITTPPAATTPAATPTDGN